MRDADGNTIMTVSEAARCLGWLPETVRYRAQNAGVLVDGRNVPGYYSRNPRWFVPESWVDAVGTPDDHLSVAQRRIKRRAEQRQHRSPLSIS